MFKRSILSLAGFLAVSLALSPMALAGGICAPKAFGYESVCGSRFDRAACEEFVPVCIWANAGRVACSAHLAADENLCLGRVDKQSCDDGIKCFWLGPNM
jgi:hypothetical protein